MNINILGISELKWMGMGGFSSEDHFNYGYGQDSLRRNRVVLIVNKKDQNVVLGCNQKRKKKKKNNRIISVCFQGKPCNITVI